MQTQTELARCPHCRGIHPINLNRLTADEDGSTGYFEECTVCHHTFNEYEGSAPVTASV